MMYKKAKLFDDTEIAALNRNTWKGTNWLGEAFTKVRNDII